MRATWLQGVRAESLSRARADPAPRDGRRCRPAAGRSTTAPASSSGSASARRPSMRTRSRSRIRARRRSRSSERSGSTRTVLYPLLADRTHGFVYVERQADPAQAAALQRLKLPGFGFYPEERRSYPQRSVAAQVLGYVGIDGNGLVGTRARIRPRARRSRRARRRSSRTRAAASSTCSRSGPRRRAGTSS